MDLRDSLDWRLRIITYGLEYLAAHNGEPQHEQILSDIGMAVRECQVIVSGKEG